MPSICMHVDHQVSNRLLIALQMPVEFLEFIDFVNCFVGKSELVKASVGPCYDTPGCKLPSCCGVISGVQSQISITYKASRPLNNGKAEAFFSALGIGSVDSELFIRIPSIKVPYIMATYYSDLCRYTKCPQVSVNTYTVTAPFKFITKALTTLVKLKEFILRGHCFLKTIVKIFSRVLLSTLHLKHPTKMVLKQLALEFTLEFLTSIY